MTPTNHLPDDIDGVKQLLLAREEELVSVTAEAATLRAKAADDQALIAHLKLQIEKLRRERFGAPNAVPACSISSSCSSRSWKPRRPRTSWLPRRPRLTRPRRSPGPPTSGASPAIAPPASRSPSTCCASG